ncbi:MAG: hypothetical protein EAZ90_28625 [Oscillatoriales cyanobacterium]|nr:MAG: hypothetical protein EAZ94_30210 [Oscillatoriales cyanobacterium]TAE30331.1 MAG: hypothetical protein EAZ93_00880 [Oscillatoriales cyanobacterium]TAE36360.1 MAG: hypothetical protein EAZ90_28625 [Oscillatoriales cyanobacterium]TAE69797.1 MAG: hypothetical protein EAZ86_09355 [Oscillatoriales cyanobacterium]TAG94021.1 MAG: hypothetical protein EAZ19_14730 [Oscillatoriales cyanobacterium]
MSPQSIAPKTPQTPILPYFYPVFAKVYKKNLRFLHKTTELTLISKQEQQKGNEVKPQTPKTPVVPYFHPVFAKLSKKT